MVRRKDRRVRAINSGGAGKVLKNEGEIRFDLKSTASFRSLDNHNKEPGF